MPFSSLFMRVAMLALVGLIGLGAHAAPTPDGPLPLQVTVDDAHIVWTPTAAYGQLLLTVSGPDGIEIRRSFDGVALPSLDLAEVGLPDGSYTYEAVLTGLTADDHESAVQTGRFEIEAGAATAIESVRALFHSGDGSITGSLCMGFDCATSESFGSDTVRLKENNLRIHFDDTSSSGSFPSNDWRIQINDSSNGGEAYFGVVDATAGTTPFRVRAGAGNHALYVNNRGDVGLGTASPVLELQITDGDTPSVRLEQNGSNGWTPQTWDVAGNETNFFVRDVTNSSALPFRIRAGAPNNALYIQNNGNMGVGTQTPGSRLDVQGTANVTGAATLGATLAVTGAATFGDDITATLDVEAGKDMRVGRDIRIGGDILSTADFADTDTPVEIRDNQGTSGSSDDVTLMELDGTGNLVINGTLTQGSNVLNKTDIVPVAPASVLAAVVEMPISTWRYATDAASVRHLGPMAQDFHAAFGLGATDTGIAAVDADGVALASIQALASENADLRARIERLERQVEALLQR